MYIATDTLPIIRHIELIRKKKFSITTFHYKNETYVVYIASISIDLDVYLSCRVQITLLKTDKYSTSISSKYVDFVYIFFYNLVAKLSKQTKINDHPIDLIKKYQPLYRPIYSLRLVELKILKTTSRSIWLIVL